MKKLAALTLALTLAFSGHVGADEKTDLFDLMCVTTNGIPSSIGEIGKLCIHSEGISAYADANPDSMYTCIGYMGDIYISTRKRGICVVILLEGEDDEKIKSMYPTLQKLGISVLLVSDSNKPDGDN